MKKEQVERSIFGVIEMFARKEIKVGLVGWPPTCNGFMHQPERPKIRDSK